MIGVEEMKENRDKGVCAQEGGCAASQRTEQFVGSSPAFQSIEECIDSVAPRESCVVVVGETGTGKEMVARAIHARSLRASKTFLPVDCTALSGQIFESQLFGHLKGAFTGAIRDTLGFFRAADGGTIFLDEISEIEIDLQAKLLRVLQESCVVPVGCTEPHPIDVRVICAANRDLKQMVREGRFRTDLYFRLNVIKIEVPPLRERKGDILILAEHFLNKLARLYDEPDKSLSGATSEILTDYDWPGNVRELANTIEHAYVTSKTEVIAPSSLSSDILANDLLLPVRDEAFPSFEDMEKRLVVRALQATGGQKMAAAKLLRVDHRKLARLVAKFNLEPTWK